MAERHARQDERVFRSSRPIADNLDLTVYRDGSAGWCLTTREPLHDRSLAEGAVAIATIAQQTGFSDQARCRGSSGR